MPKDFLIIGAGGLIGRRAASEIDSQGHSWSGTYFSRLASRCIKFDIMNTKDTGYLFTEIKPRYVLCCASLSGGLNFCEDNKELARKFHYEATLNIARECQSCGSRFVYLSSECVFDGKKELYVEEDPVNPINVYGRCKAESEEWITKNLKDYVIIRAMSVYGWDPMTTTPNAVMKAYFSILKRENIGVPVFRWGTPTYVGDFAKAMVELALSPENGIFHIAGTSFVNRYDWLFKTAAALGWDTDLIIPVKEPDAKELLRPLKVLLETSKFRRRYATKLHSLQEGIKLLKEEYSKKGEVFYKHENIGNYSGL